LIAKLLAKKDKIKLSPSITDERLSHIWLRQTELEAKLKKLRLVAMGA
jgi:hypothetical protein